MPWPSKSLKRVCSRRFKVTLAILAVWILFSMYTFVTIARARRLVNDQAGVQASAPVEVELVFHQFDPDSLEATVDCRVSKSGSNGSGGVLVVLDGDEHSLAWGASKPTKLSFVADEHWHLYAYPLDVYWKALQIQVMVKSEEVPFRLAVKTTNGKFSVTYSSTGKNTFQLKQTRVWFTVLFAVVVNIVMWLMAWGMLIFAVDIWWFHPKVTADSVAASFGLLFALPSLRDAQPDIPAVGCGIDHVGFMW